MGSVQKNIAWLAEARASAESIYQDLPLPDRRDELFKYTYLGGIDFNQELNHPAEFPADQKMRSTTESGLLCLNGADLAYRNTDAAEIEQQQLIFCDMKSALAENSELLKKYLSVEKFPKNKFAALAEARWQNGTFLFVPAGRRVQGAIRVSQFLGSKNSYQNRSLFVVGKAAEVTIVEDCFGDSESLDTGFANSLSEIFLEEGAVVHYVLAQNWSAGTNYFLRQNVELARNSKLFFYALNSGAKKSQQHLEVNLIGEGAELKAICAAQGDKEQHLDFVANFVHKAPHTKSALDHWAVMAGQAKGVFNGMIHVEQNALHTDAYQKSRSLLLSKSAAVHSMPKLIIATDEVACQHGASISRIDPDQMFYLESRGMDPAEATRTIVAGFTEPVLDAIASEALRERFREYLARKALGNA